MGEHWCGLVAIRIGGGVAVLEGGKGLPVPFSNRSLDGKSFLLAVPILLEIFFCPNTFQMERVWQIPTAIPRELKKLLWS